MTLIYAFLLILLLGLAWLSILLGMPGNWLMVMFAAVYAYFVPEESAAGIGWPVVMVMVFLSATGEVVEFFASAAGTAKAGGTRRSAVLALVGSLCGGILGVFIGLPIPVVGSLFGALFFASLGAMIGAIVGETWAGKDLLRSWKTGKGAFMGRLLGTMGKMVFGAVMIALVMAAMIL